MANLKGAGSYPVVARGKTNQSTTPGGKEGFNMKPVNKGSMHFGGMKDVSDNRSGEVDPEGRR